jgi:hypothetical protein
MGNQERQFVLHVGVPLVARLYHRGGWSKVTVLSLYSEGIRFESRPEHSLSLLRYFMVALSPVRQMAE